MELTPSKRKPSKWNSSSQYFRLESKNCKHFPLGIIENLGIPVWVVAFLASMKVLIISSIEKIQSFQNIFYSVGMHNIQDDGNSQSVRFFNQIFQIFWSSKSGRWRKKTRHMIAERAIIRMFLNCHHLDCRVTISVNSWQNVIGKFSVSSQSRLFVCHADMAFVNQRMLGRFWRIIISTPIKFLFWYSKPAPQILWFLHSAPLGLRRRECGQFVRCLQKPLLYKMIYAQLVR